MRPSTAAGKKYPDVSRAYYEQVNAVLKHQKSASRAAAELQLELEQIVEKDAGGASARLYQQPPHGRR